MLLFLDVDGTLIPFGSTRPYPVYDACGPGAVAAGDDVHPLLARVDPALGPRLAALGCVLVWATTWGDAANALVAPRLGLPPLPVVKWAEVADEVADGVADPDGPHWKTRPLVDWAAGRPFVWLDDEITDADRAWVAAHHPAPALLHRVDARDGITAADLAALTDWIRKVDEERGGARRPTASDEPAAGGMPGTDSVR